MTQFPTGANTVTPASVENALEARHAREVATLYTNLDTYIGEVPVLDKDEVLRHESPFFLNKGSSFVMSDGSAIIGKGGTLLDAMKKLEIPLASGVTTLYYMTRFEQEAAKAADLSYNFSNYNIPENRRAVFLEGVVRMHPMRHRVDINECNGRFNEAMGALFDLTKAMTTKEFEDVGKDPTENPDEFNTAHRKTRTAVLTGMLVKMKEDPSHVTEIMQKLTSARNSSN